MYIPTSRNNNRGMGTSAGTVMSRLFTFDGRESVYAILGRNVFLSPGAGTGMWITIVEKSSTTKVTTPSTTTTTPTTATTTAASSLFWSGR